MSSLRVGQVLQFLFLLGHCPIFSCQSECSNGFKNSSAICCNGALRATTDINEPSCCGSIEYDAQYNICCDSILWSTCKLRKPNCCGSMAYDATVSFCCIGEVFSKCDPSKPPCCGPVIHVGEICCSGPPCPPLRG